MELTYQSLLKWFTFLEGNILRSRVVVPHNPDESWGVKAQRTIVAGCIFMLVIEDIIALVEARDFLEFLVPACWSSIMVQISYQLVNLVFRPDIYRELMQWCESRYSLKLHPVVQGLVKKNMDEGLKEALFMTKGIVIGFYLDYFMVIWIPAIFGSFLPPDMWPEFNLPFPGHLPFYPSYSNLSCGINFAFQGVAIFVLVTICGVGFSLAFVTLCFIKAQINLLNDVTRTFFKMMDVKDKNGERIMSYESFLKIVVNLHNDLLRKFEILNGVVSIVCFLLEFNSCGGIFLVAIVLMVDGGKKTLLMGLSTTAAIALLGGFSYFSDEMKEKLNNISWNLYDCPWWRLSPKEQRQLIPVIRQTQRPRAVASLFYFMTMERFGSLLKMSYSYCIALNNLLTR